MNQKCWFMVKASRTRSNLLICLYNQIWKSLFYVSFFPHGPVWKGSEAAQMEQQSKVCGKILNNDFFYNIFQYILIYILPIQKMNNNCLYNTQSIVWLFNKIWSAVKPVGYGLCQPFCTAGGQVICSCYLSFGCMNIMFSNENFISVFVYIGTKIGCTS